MVQSLPLFLTPWTAACPLCPPQSFGACLNSYPLSLWWYLTISYSATLFSSSPQSFPSLGSFTVSHLLTPGGQIVGASPSAISPSNECSGLISFRIDWFDLPAVEGTLKSLLQHHNSKASILWLSTFFIVHLSHPYTIGKTIALTRQTLSAKQCLFYLICCVGLSKLFF